MNDRAVYCVALVIANGGRIGYDELRDIILEFKEPFHGLNENYVKYKLVKKILKRLVEDRFLL